MNDGYLSEHKAMFECLVKRGLTESEAEYVVNLISNRVRQCDMYCSDNFRLSINGNNKEEYDEALKNGCCGFWDEKVELKSGKVVEFGFNYGH